MAISFRFPTEYLSRSPHDGFKVLGDVTRRAPGGQLALGWSESWDNLNFAHIPVGVLGPSLSALPEQTRRAGTTQTGRLLYPPPYCRADGPRYFVPLVEEGRAVGARVLDPATGAGVFLLTAFQRIVAERWRKDGVRPGTQTLRKILYEQITGFDIDNSALRFAALGLYLMSIELDPEPEPVAKLIFEDLRGRVLHQAGKPTTPTEKGLGSLDPNFQPELSGAYDLVIGNPPWSSGTQLPGWSDSRPHRSDRPPSFQKAHPPAVVAE